MENKKKILVRILIATVLLTPLYYSYTANDRIDDIDGKILGLQDNAKNSSNEIHAVKERDLKADQTVAELNKRIGALEAVVTEQETKIVDLQTKLAKPVKVEKGKKK